jgi:hypothetical protein
MSTEVVQAAPIGGGLALNPSLMAKLAAQAKEAAAKERPSLAKVSLKAGVMTIGGSPIAGNKLPAIILVAAYRNTFYKGRYDPNNIVNPNCFAFGLSDEGLAPGERVRSPVHATCAGCPNAEWGTDLNGGRGKACKESRRLVMIPASVLGSENPVEAVKTAEMAVVDIPVTSVRNFSQYINVLSTSVGLPMQAVVTEIWPTPDAKSQFKLNFKGINAVPTEEILNAIMLRAPDAERIGLEGYGDSADESTDPDEGQASAETKPSAKKAKF